MKNLYLLVMVVLLSAQLQSCTDANEGALEFSTKEELLVTSFLEAEADTYSEFLALMRACRIDKMLNAYGSYACFIPTNEAVRAYYAEKGTSLEQLNAEEVEAIVFNHIISCGNSDPIESHSFPNGTINTATMSGRYLQISYPAEEEVAIGNDSVFVNKTACIIRKDQKVHNGVVHTINRVVEVSSATLPGMLEAAGFTLFAEALKATGWADYLEVTKENADYEKGKKSGDIPDRIATLISYDNSALRKTPDHCFYGFTVLAESDETLRTAGITDLASMKAYAEAHYGSDVFPDGDGVTDITDPRNSFNRFVAYHIIDRMLDRSDFIPSYWKQFYVQSATLVDYVETLANRLIEVQQSASGPIFNKRMDNGLSVALKPQNNDFLNVTDNGVLHEIDKVLSYEGVETQVLNKRLRMDVTSLVPEMTTNKLRGWYQSPGGETLMIIPSGSFTNSEGQTIKYDYFQNLKYTESSQLHIYGTTGDYNNLGDEFLFVGKYDLTLRLPPVPPGRYEIRVGYSANSNRAVSQLYVDGMPCGIPLDMKISPTYKNELMGWVADGDDETVNRDNDKAMKNHGYMKAPASVKIPSSGEILRDKSALRKIVDVRTWLKTEPHYLRIKSVEESTQAQMMIDYIELVPSTVWETEDIN
ncbi:hypothetical protein AGMMS49965_15390 [Bacteroidia bacterium]|nr:hypothetical protein AGMMS49965_15390 [Bacteroidia bacterium]